MHEFAVEMLKRGKHLGYDLETLRFIAGYINDLGVLRLHAGRDTDHRKLSQDAEQIFAQNPHLHTIRWNDGYVDFLESVRHERRKLITKEESNP